MFAASYVAHASPLNNTIKALYHAYLSKKNKNKKKVMRVLLKAAQTLPTTIGDVMSVREVVALGLPLRGRRPMDFVIITHEMFPRLVGPFIHYSV